MATYYNPTRAPVPVVLPTGSTVVPPKGRVTVLDEFGMTQSLQDAIDAGNLVDCTRRPSAVLEAPTPVAPAVLRFPAADHVVPGKMAAPAVSPVGPAAPAADPLANLHDFFPTPAPVGASEDLP